MRNARQNGEECSDDGQKAANDKRNHTILAKKLLRNVNVLLSVEEIIFSFGKVIFGPEAESIPNGCSCSCSYNYQRDKQPKR